MTYNLDLISEPFTFRSNKRIHFNISLVVNDAQIANDNQIASVMKLSHNFYTILRTSNLNSFLKSTNMSIWIRIPALSVVQTYKI